MSEMDAEIKARMRDWLAEHGTKVKFDDRYGYKSVDTFGWEDQGAFSHIHGDKYNEAAGGPCYWVIPEGTVIKEESYSQFNGTDQDNSYEVGINAEHIDCACGKYKDVTVRIASSLGDAIQALLGYDPSKQITL